MTILVTGAFGNLGMMLVQALLRRGHRVRLFDIRNNHNCRLAARLPVGTQVVWGDIRDAAMLSNVVTGVGVVIHLAAVLPPVTDNQPGLAQQINVTGTENLLNALAQHAPDALIIYASSVAVFGLRQADPAPRRVDEPVLATDNYTRHKLACETLLQTSRQPWIIMRIGVSVDSRTTATDWQTLKKLFAVSAENRLEYVHPLDVAEAMASAVDCEAARNKILLIGGGPSCQIRQRRFLETLFSAAGIVLPLKVHGSETFYTDWMDTSESQALLNYQSHSFADYQQEMVGKLRWVRRLAWPVRFLLSWFLGQLLSPARNAGAERVSN